MSDTRGEDRVSIWSVSEKERMLFIGMALTFFLSALVFVLKYKHTAEDDFYVIISNLIEATGPVGLSAVTLTFFLIEGYNLMLVPIQKIRAKTEEYLARRFKEGRQSERKEIFAAIQDAYPDIDIETVIRATTHRRQIMEEIENALADDVKRGITFEHDGFYIDRPSKALEILLNSDNPIPPQIESECKTIVRQFLEYHRNHFSQDAIKLLEEAIRRSRR